MSDAPASPSSDRSRLGRRVAMTLVGVFGTGFGVGVLRLALLGMDPFQTLMGGFAAMFSAISFGALWVIVNGLMLLVALIFKRRLIGLGTVLGLTLLGYVIDGSHHWLLSLFPAPSLLLRVAFLALAMLILCLMAALYFTADMGVSAYDAIALILAERLPRIPFKYWRIITDSLCVIIGVSLFLLAGRAAGELGTLVGIGTIIVALGMGPLIAFFTEKIAKPLLQVPLPRT